jgi:hypothetical protein
MEQAMKAATTITFFRRPGRSKGTNVHCTVHRENFVLTDAIGSHACELIANTRVNQPLSLEVHSLTVTIVNPITTLKA